MKGKQHMSEYTTLKILFLEDAAQDVELMEHELRQAGINFVSQRVSSKKDFLESLDSFKPDIVLADYTLPSFNGMHAFRLLKEKNILVPFIIVTGSLDEGLAADCLSEGVDDYVLKESYKRLPSVIKRNLKIKEAEKERARTSEELKKQEEELQSLRKETLKAKPHEELSNREFEILILIASGKAVKEIADQLFISPSTVATYRNRILEKMDLKNDIEITHYVLRNKLIE
jgi:DNA-binding NarL/FixJ family response regulator